MGMHDPRLAQALIEMAAVEAARNKAGNRDEAPGKYDSPIDRTPKRRTNAIGIPLFPLAAEYSRA